MQPAAAPRNQIKRYTGAGPGSLNPGADGLKYSGSARPRRRNHAAESARTVAPVHRRRRRHRRHGGDGEVPSPGRHHQPLADYRRGADAAVSAHCGRRADATRARNWATGATDQAVANLAFQRLAIAFGKKILAIVPGRVSTEVDARLSYDTEATIAQARSIIAQYDAAGIGRDRVLIKIASTWEGIRAAEVLEKEGIHCNLTLLFGLHQAIAAADAGVTLISPFVGRILDWYKKDTGKDYQGADDPGVQSVTRIYNYFKKFGYKTVVMGASFRNIGEIRELAGCDLLTISPQLLAELEATAGRPAAQALAETAKSMQIEKINMDKATFDRMHAADRMATDKLKEGIDQNRHAAAAQRPHDRLRRRPNCNRATSRRSRFRFSPTASTASSSPAGSPTPRRQCTS